MFYSKALCITNIFLIKDNRRELKVKKKVSDFMRKFIVCCLGVVFGCPLHAVMNNGQLKKVETMVSYDEKYGPLTAVDAKPQVGGGGRFEPTTISNLYHSNRGFWVC